MPIFMPLKIFFVLLVIGIGLLLSVWRDKIDQLYRDSVPGVERGVIVGAFAMLLWPAMDYGYQQTSNVLFGRWEGLQLRLSVVIAPWALLLLFYFLRRLGKQGETIGQIAGVVTAAVALLRYEDLNDWAVRLLGVGSQDRVMAGLLALALAGLVGLLWPWRSRFVPPPTKPRGCRDIERRLCCDSDYALANSPRCSGNTAAETAGDRRCSPCTTLRKVC